MADILKILLSNQVTVKEVVDWLICDEEFVSPPCLKEFDSIRCVFVPFFLNYLREQTSALVQASHAETVSTLTPNKTPVRSKSNPGDKPVINSRRIRLFAQNASEKENACSLNISVDEVLEHGNVAKIKPDGRKPSNWRKDGAKKDNHQWHHKKMSHSLPLESTPRHKQKLSFGQYINCSSNTPTIPEKIIACHSDPSYKHKKRDGRNEEFISGRLFENNEENVPFDDLQAFPPIGTPISSNQKKNRIPKRIKPTMIKSGSKSNITSIKSSPVFSVKREEMNDVLSISETSTCNAFNSSLSEKSSSSLAEERELLKKEKMKWSQTRTFSNMSEIECAPSPIKSNAQFRPGVNQDEISPASPDNVTYNFELKIISLLYSSLITYNLVPNVSVELYFVLQLLTLRFQPKITTKSVPVHLDIDDIAYLSTVHNCTFFAIVVLEQQIKLLQCLDITLIKMLVDMSRVEKFSSSLKCKLQELCDLETTKQSYAPLTCNDISGVSFQADTDNQNNFLSVASFHTFRKQRDLFYEIIRLWENNRLTCGWSLMENAGGKIRMTVDMRMDPISYSHFARLFVNQLIVMCKGQGLSDSKSIGESQSTNYEDLANILNVNPEKMKKLHHRFVKPNHTGGICPPPAFHGYQEFFKDFILVAQSPYFIQHLVDHLTFKIHELNEVQFNFGEDHQNGDDNIDEIQGQFYDVFQTLRILGKFLGFILFLPYRTSQKISEYILSSETIVRSKVQPPVDILAMLSESIVKHKKILVIPWVVEFLSMIDSVAPFIEYYEKVLSLTVFIYRISHHSATSRSNMLILALLGWLFQTPNFPESLLYQEKSELMALQSNDKNVPDNDVTFKLDDMNLIAQNTLYSCCPFLSELRLLVSAFCSGTGNRADKEVRKITPVTNNEKLSISRQGQMLSTQLEENFFHNQPTSLKKTVEFVADRIASNAIKHIRSQIIPKIHSACCDDLKVLIGEYEVKDSEEFEEIQAIFKREINSRSSTACEQSYTNLLEYSSGYVEKQSEKLFPLLLPEDTSCQVVNTSQSISRRMANDKIRNWSSKYVTINYFVKELMFECDKIWKQKLLNKSVASKDSFGIPCCGTHDDQHVAPSILIMQAKNIVKRLNDINQNENIKEAEILKLLTDTRVMQSNRDDLTLVVIKTMCILIAEICISIASNCPSLWTSPVESSLKNIWSMPLFEASSTYASALISILSPKSILQLSHSDSPKLSWQVYKSLLHLVVEKKFLSPSMLPDQFRKVSACDWSKAVKQQIALLEESLLHHD